jgi:hypothetical protein
MLSMWTSPENFVSSKVTGYLQVERPVSISVPIRVPNVFGIRIASYIMDIGDISFGDKAARSLS